MEIPLCFVLTVTLLLSGSHVSHARQEACSTRVCTAALGDAAVVDRTFLADLGDDLMEELDRDFSNELDTVADELLRYADRSSGDRDSRRALLGDQELKTLFDVDENSVAIFDGAINRNSDLSAAVAAPTSTTTTKEMGTHSSKRSSGFLQSKMRKGRRTRTRRRRRQGPSRQLRGSKGGSKGGRRSRSGNRRGVGRSPGGVRRVANTSVSKRDGASAPFLRQSAAVPRAQHRSHRSSSAINRNFVGGCGVGDVVAYADQRVSLGKWDSKDRLRVARRLLTTAAVGAVLSIIAPGQRLLVFLTMPFVHVLAGFCLRAASRFRYRSWFPSGVGKLAVVLALCAMVYGITMVATLPISRLRWNSDHH